MQFFRSKKNGFTFVELLVVMAIIALLSSIILAQLNKSRMKSRDARRIADVKQIQLALSLYYNDNGVYPSSPLSSAANFVPNYISTLPKDPSSQLDYAYAGLQGYAPTASGGAKPCGSYHLGAKLEDTGNNALNDAFQGVPSSGTMSGKNDGNTCDSGSFAGNADIAASGGDFSGFISGTNSVYDVRP